MRLGLVEFILTDTLYVCFYADIGKTIDLFHTVYISTTVEETPCQTGYAFN